MYSNRLWLDKSDLDANQLMKIKERLTLMPVKFRGRAEDVLAFEEIDNFIGVPREWGKQQKWLPTKFSFDIQTVSATIEWPEFNGTFRHGQDSAIKRVVAIFDKETGCLLEGKCGSGKTVTSLNIAKSLGQRTLVTVHKDDLLEQWKEEAEKRFPGIKVGIIKGKKSLESFSPAKYHIVLSMAKTLYMYKDSLSYENFHRFFGLHIFDEGHHYPSKTFEPILGLLPARYKLGVSATWRRKDGLEPLFYYHLGSKLVKLQAPLLVGQYKKVLWNTPVQESTYFKYGQLQTAGFINRLVYTEKYIDFLVTSCMKSCDAGRRILVLADRVNLLYRILDGLIEKDYGKKTGLYVGAHKRLGKETLNREIVLATYAMFSEGTDSPTLDTLLFATPRSDIEQSVGRIQRPAEGKKDLLIVDPVFNTPYNLAMFEKRLSHYSKLGFTEFKKVEDVPVSATV